MNYENVQVKMSRTGDTSQSLSQRTNEATLGAPIITCLFTAIPSMALQRDTKTIFTAHYPILPRLQNIRIFSMQK